MRQMLSSLQESPVIALCVLVIFSGLFGYILFECLRKKNKQSFKEAALVPLEDQERI